jgi:hypothetical protein
LVRKLRREIPADCLVAQVIYLQQPDKPPVDQLLPGDWPIQRRSD